MIVAENISKTYKTKKGKQGFFKREIKYVDAVKNFSISIPKGKITGLLGINGAGKTTIIKMLSTLLSPDSGTIFIDEIDAVKEYMQAKTKINLISGGERNIYWRLTALENLEYFGSLYGIPKKVLKERIESILHLVGLYEICDIPVEKYSKGQKQRLQIARGLINNPDYIFLDEPTLGLDIVFAKQIREYIKLLAEKLNKGILLTTHYIYEADELCDYIYLIHKGELVCCGSPREIKEKVKLNKNYCIEVHNPGLKTEIVSYLNSYRDLVKKSNVSDEQVVITLVQGGEKALFSKLIDKFGPLSIKELVPSLEEAVLELIGGK